MIKKFKNLISIPLLTIGFIIVVNLLIFCLIILNFFVKSITVLTSGVNIQNWLINSFEITPNTATSIIASLAIFIAGLLITWSTKFIEKLIDRYRYRRILTNFSKTLAFALTRKSNQFRKCAETMDVKLNGNFLMSDMALTHLDNIQKIEITRFNNAYYYGIENLGRTLLKNKDFDNIFSVISNINRIENLYINQFEKFLSRYNVLEERRNNAIMRVKEIIDKLQDDAFKECKQNDLPQDFIRYLMGIREIVENWNKIENNTIPSIFDEFFIQKLRHLNSVYKENECVRKRLPNSLYYAINDSSNEYLSMKILVETNNQIFLNYSISYKNQARKLFDSINQLNHFPIFKIFQ